MNIVFVVCFPFPYGSASSMRARNIYKLLELAGHNVHVIADYNTTVFNADCKSFSYEYIYDNMTFLHRRVAPYRCLKRLNDYIKKNKVDCLIANARFERFNMLSEFCKKNKIKYIVENCEWYDYSSFKLGKLNIDYIRNDWMIGHSFRKADGFISISRLLDEHNKALGVSSVRIPTILDVENTTFSRRNKGEKIIISYTGSLGNGKELLYPMISCLAENEEFANNIEFHIYGPSEKEILTNISGQINLLEKTRNCIFVHGRIPQNEVNNILESTDYLFFMRPQRRSSAAGFPTKLGESFAVGTPVITNNTGDIGLYVKNGINGFVISEKNKISDVLSEIIKLKASDYMFLRENARNTAETYFDYRKYTDSIAKITSNR